MSLNESEVESTTLALFFFSVVVQFCLTDPLPSAVTEQRRREERRSWEGDG